MVTSHEPDRDARLPLRRDTRTRADAAPRGRTCRKGEARVISPQNPCLRRLANAEELRIEPFPNIDSPRCLVAVQDLAFGRYVGLVSKLEEPPAELGFG